MHSLRRILPVTNDQCNAIIKAISELTNAVRDVATNIDNIYTYSDLDLRKEVHLIAEILEDIKDFRL